MKAGEGDLVRLAVDPAGRDVDGRVDEGAFEVDVEDGEDLTRLEEGSGDGEEREGDGEEGEAHLGE